MALQKLARSVPLWLVYAALLAALALALVYAPPEATMGNAYRIMFYHIGAAWNALLGFLVTFVASLAYLRRGDPAWDRLAFASAEVGVFFTSVTLVSGSIWGRAVWLTWWTWEPRLTTTLLLWFIYVFYLLLRGSAEGDAARMRLSAVVAVVGFVDEPVVYLSVFWWRGLHPMHVQLAHRMVVALAVSVAAFTLFYLYLLGRRLTLESLSERVQDLKERHRRELD
jgi:heme exporter protein C